MIHLPPKKKKKKTLSAPNGLNPYLALLRREELGCVSLPGGP